MRNEVLLMYKNVGETPLQALHRLRMEKPELAKEKLSYAGRLDPLAEGELLVLIGTACTHREPYLDLDKTYVVDILLGVSTDTHDVLGLVTDTSNKDVSQTEIEDTLKSFVGSFSQLYPNYSSKMLGRLVDDDSRPHKDVTIYSMHVDKHYILTPQELIKNIKEKVNSVHGDFRQQSILKKWDEYFTTNTRETFPVIQVTVHCSSGTYMRVLADELGKKLGTGALALHIKREKIFLV